MKEEIKRFVILNTEKYIVQNKPFVLNGEAAIWNGKKFLFATIKEEDDFKFELEDMIKNYVQQSDFYQTTYLVVYDFYQYFYQQLFPDFEPEYEYVKYLIDKKMFHGAFVMTMLSILKKPERFVRKILQSNNKDNIFKNKKKCLEIFFNIIEYEIKRERNNNSNNILLTNRYFFIFMMLFQIIYGYAVSKLNNDIQYEESFFRKYLENIFNIELIGNKNEI
jgi:hypothetical protein